MKKTRGLFSWGWRVELRRQCPHPLEYALLVLECSLPVFVRVLGLPQTARAVQAMHVRRSTSRGIRERAGIEERGSVACTTFVWLGTTSSKGNRWVCV